MTALADRLGGSALTSRLSFEEWTGQTAEKAQIVPNGDAFTIKATSLHTASLALGVYLRDVAKGHVSWCGNRMPETWALPTQTIDVQARYPLAMAYNYCTLSYTMAYWSKEAWQNEIDRLALSGYTTALCMAGVQKIWKLTLEELGYTQRQREDFIVDDAQQAWWLMGNLQGQGNGTPAGRFPIVSEDEIEADADVGRFIVRQMRAVGIEPVLQAFIGLVPSSTTKDQIVAYLNAHPEVCTQYGITDTSAAVNIFVNGYYNEGHKNPDLVDPNCPAFRLFSDVWNKNLKAVYGMTDAKDYPKYLGGDLFHESSPPKTMTEEEKNNCAKFAQQYQQAAFPGVTWVLQNWQSAPVQDLRNGLDPAHTIIQRLDQTMSATDARTANYVNYKAEGGATNIPWVWVEVMNFGGNTGMHGALRRFRNVGNLGGNASFRGYGLLSEGLETNPVSYDMYHWAMAKTTADEQNISDDELEPWLEAYRLRRYGYTDDNLKAAHTICARTVWNCTRDQQGTIESVFCAKPGYGVTKVSAWGPTTGTPYDRLELVTAAEYMLATAKARRELMDLATFRYDFVEIFQQILADKAREINPDCATSAKRRAEFRRMLELVDAILACSDEWRLDKKEARVLGKAPVSGPAAYRRMITTWTPGGRHQTQLSQYAHRSYAGLVKHYYAKKWNAFFDVTEGTLSQTAYNTLCDTLDEEFPTTVLPETPTDGDPIALAEEILDLLDPPALTWTGATDSVWEHANWKDGKGQSAEWENGKSVVLSGVGQTIAAEGAVTVGNIALEKRSVAAADTGWLDTSAAIVLAANTTVEAAHMWDYSGIMSGGWFGNPQRQCPATGYHKSAISGNAFTLQFQAIDNSDGTDWLKVVSVKIYQDGNDVKIVSTGAANQNKGTLGSGPLSPVANIPANSTGYSVKQIATHRPSAVTVTGPVVVDGEMTLNDGESLALPGATLIDTVLLEKGTATLGLGAAQTLTVNAALVANGAKLVLKGSAATLQGAAGTTRVKLPKTALANVVYVGSEGDEQALTLDAEGFLKTQVCAQTYADAISGDTNLGWKNLTLDDLASCAFTSAETLARAVTRNADSVMLMIGTATVTLTLVDGIVHATSTEALAGLRLEPAVARVVETGTNFPALTDAIRAANGASKVALLGDATVMGAINNSFKTWIEIPHGLTLTATCGDFIYWDKAYTLDIYGTLDLAGNALSVGVNKGHAVNLYAGGTIKSTSTKGLAVFTADTAVNVLPCAGFATATLDTPVQARQNTTLAVADGVTAVLNGNIVLMASGESGTATPVVTKTGPGTLAFNGSVASGATLVLSAGTLARVMPVGDSLTVTVNGGATAMTADNADAKVVETVAGAVHVFTCVEKAYRYRVTDPGEISVNMPGTNYETFAEALAAATALQNAHPGTVVNLWVISQEVEQLAQADVAAYNQANGTSLTLFGDGNGIAIQNWYAGTPKLFFPANVTDWNASVKVATTKDGAATETVKAGDVIRFANGATMPSASGNLYIASAVVAREILVTDNTTLRLGSESGQKYNLRDGWKVTVDAGSTLILRGWGNANRADIHFDGTVTLDGEGVVTIDASDAPTAVWNSVKGTATVTIPSGVTVTINGTIENTIALAVGGTVKAKNPIVVTPAPKGYRLVQTTADGYTTYAFEEYTTKVVYFKSGYIGNETSLALAETSGGAAAEYEDVPNWHVVIDANSPAQAWAAKTYRYADHDINITKFIVKKDFTLKNGASQDGIFEGVTFAVDAGATLTLCDSNTANQPMTLGKAHFTGAGSVNLAGVKTLTTVTAGEGTSIAFGDRKMKAETADGITTYTLVVGPTDWPEVTDLAQVDGLPDALKTADVARLTAWATGKVAWGDAASILPEAYALNCANTAEAVAQAKKDFKLTIEMQADGTAKVSLPAGADYNIAPTIRTSNDLKDWHDKAAGDHLFKAVIPVDGAGL